MLGQVRQPDPIRAICAELAPHEIIVGRSGRLAAPTGLGLAEHAPPAVLGADPPDRPLAGGEAGVADLIGQEPVPELRVVAVGVEDRVRQMRLGPLRLGDRIGQPGVVVLTVELQNPTRHRDRHPDPGAGRGELSHERVEPFPGNCAWDR